VPGGPTEVSWTAGGSSGPASTRQPRGGNGSGRLIVSESRISPLTRACAAMEGRSTISGRWPRCCARREHCLTGTSSIGCARVIAILMMNVHLIVCAKATSRLSARRCDLLPQPRGSRGVAGGPHSAESGCLARGGGAGRECQWSAVAAADSADAPICRTAVRWTACGLLGPAGQAGRDRGRPGRKPHSIQSRPTAARRLREHPCAGFSSRPPS